MFKDLPEGQTHSFNDGCIPPHVMPETTSQGNCCDKCKSSLGYPDCMTNCECHQGTTSQEEWEIRFDKAFPNNLQFGYLDIPDIKSFIRFQIKAAELRGTARGLAANGHITHDPPITSKEELGIEFTKGAEWVIEQIKDYPEVMSDFKTMKDRKSSLRQSLQQRGKKEEV